MGGCHRGHSVDHRSFIEYECEYAVDNDLKIVVLYNSCSVMRGMCPEVLRYKGAHLAAIFRGADGKLYWDVGGIAQALRD